MVSLVSAHSLHFQTNVFSCLPYRGTRNVASLQFYAMKSPNWSIDHCDKLIYLTELPTKQNMTQGELHLYMRLGEKLRISFDISS